MAMAPGSNPGRGANVQWFSIRWAQVASRPKIREAAQSSLLACFGQFQVLQCDYFGRISMPLVATSLKLPKTLKSRIARLAKRAGESPHAFMLRLLEKQVQAAERFEQFVADARQADQSMRQSAQGYAAGEVHGYLEAKTAGHKATRPKPAQL